MALIPTEQSFARLKKDEATISWAKRLIDDLQRRLHDMSAAVNSLTVSGNLTFRKNSGADVGVRPRLNLIEGSNVTLTVTDDGVDNEVDVTIASSGSGAAASWQRPFAIMGG